METVDAAAGVEVVKSLQPKGKHYIDLNSASRRPLNQFFYSRALSEFGLSDSGDTSHTTVELQKDDSPSSQSSSSNAQNDSHEESSWVFSRRTNIPFTGCWHLEEVFALLDAAIEYKNTYFASDAYLDLEKVFVIRGWTTLCSLVRWPSPRRQSLRACRKKLTKIASSIKLGQKKTVHTLILQYATKTNIFGPNQAETQTPNSTNNNMPTAIRPKRERESGLTQSPVDEDAPPAKRPAPNLSTVVHATSLERIGQELRDIGDRLKNVSQHEWLMAPFGSLTDLRHYAHQIYFTISECTKNCDI